MRTPLHRGSQDNVRPRHLKARKGGAHAPGFSAPLVGRATSTYPSTFGLREDGKLDTYLGGSPS
jgi:hypothetical protein